MRQTGDDLLRRIQDLEQQLNGVVTDLGGNQIPQTPVVVSGLPAASDAGFPVFATAAAGNVSADGWYARTMSGDATMDDLGVVTINTGGAPMYGDGSDGVCNFDGTTVIAGLTPSSNVYTLTRDIYLASGSQLTGSAVINTASFRIFCQGTFTIGASATIKCDGGNASGATKGTGGGGVTATLGHGSDGGNGNTNGNGSTGTSVSLGLGAGGGAGGALSGGPGTGGGAAGGTFGAPTASQAFPRNAANAILNLDQSAGTYLGGSGGGGGNASASSTSGGGGGGGGCLLICATKLVNNGTISAKGGNGANASGSGSGAGGGGGGGGGSIIIITGSGSTIGTTTVAGGSAGTAQGAGKDGVAGSTGNVVTILGTASAGTGFIAGGDLDGTSTSQRIEEAVATNSSATGAVTVDFLAARVHKLTLTGTVSSLTINNAISGRACGITLYLIQDGTGSRTVTAWTNVKWPAGTAPTLSTAASSVDIVVLESTDGGTTWYGNLAGKGYA